MVLPSQFALDSETDRCDEPGVKVGRLAMLQASAVGNRDIENVKVWIGWDCDERFFEECEETLFDMECHMFNMDYEMKNWLRPFLERSAYEWVPKTRNGRVKKGCWSFIESDNRFYRVTVHLFNGCYIIFTDDSKRVSGSMAEIAEALRKTHPSWFLYDVVKEKVDYNNGWLNEEHPDHEKFIHYGKLDAVSQGLIAQYLIDEGYTQLTKARHGFEQCIEGMYGAGDASGNRMALDNEYPIPDKDMCDLAERCLIGGFVWVQPDYHKKGVFTHMDYSSSYPGIYYNGRMFKGRIGRIKMEDRMSKKIMLNERLFRWYKVSFGFRLKKGMIPVIAGAECITEDDKMIGKWRLKIEEGKVEHRLYTEDYLMCLGRFYEILDLEIEEMYYAEASQGFCPDFMQMHYTEKSLSDGIVKLMHKDAMNTGPHGKTITKTKHRKYHEYVDGVWTTMYQDTDREYNNWIGFSGMMGRRTVLLNDVATVLEHGGHVLMCDTDSMVVDRNEQWVREALGEGRFGKPISKKEKADYGLMCEEDKAKLRQRIIANIGLFEFEENKKNGKVEFDEFNTYGMKRYLEKDNGEYRKSAFAGMTKELQEQLLMDWDGKGELTWKQKGKVHDKYGDMIGMITKHVKSERVVDVGFNYDGVDTKTYAEWVKELREM